jgi:hypothetical protein
MILGFLGNIQSRVMEWVSYFFLNALGLVADNKNLGLLYPLRSYFVITDVEKSPLLPKIL